MRHLLASCLGLGHLPRLWGGREGGGTVSALAVLSLVLWANPGVALQLSMAVGLTVLGIWAVSPFAEDDPNWVTVDEAAGTLLATLGLQPIPALVAFLVFRLADITKRFPGVGRAQRLSGAAGVMADDIVAGLWGLGAGWLTRIVLG